MKRKKTAGSHGGGSSNNCRLLFNYIESQPALHMASQPATSQYDWCGKIRRLCMICIGKPSFLFTSHTRDREVMVTVKR